MNALLLAPATRLALIGLVGVAVAGATYGYAQGASTRAQALALRYIDSLDAPLKRMLKPPRGRTIMLGQGAAVVAIVSLAFALRMPGVALASLLVLPAPRLAIRYMQKKRCEAIEAKLDGFALSLANATRAAPSIGRALLMLQSTLPKPLDEEVEQVLREMRVGSSVEQALLNCSWRVQSPLLDALLSGVLIARRIGGELPEILETTASTLREMARLDGVLRSKTAEARMQMWTLALLPVLIVAGFDMASPGYFKPLTDTPLGQLLIGIAIVCWITAILLGRKIMAVEL